MSLSLQPALTEQEINTLHDHSLGLLERVGIVFNTPKALALLADVGCKVDYDRNWASIPPQVVEWAIQQAPRVVQLGARDPNRAVTLDGSRPHHTTDSQGTRAMDFETGVVRPSLLTDTENGLLFADALDRTEIINVSVAANDVPAPIRNIQHFASAFTQTSKPIRTSVLDPAYLPYIIEMATIASGNGDFKPIFSTVDCTISPLMHDGRMTEACIELARLNVPIMVLPMPLAGGTAPVTLAGTILIHNTEFLSGLVLFQAANPGAPVIYGTVASQLDMRTGRYGGSANGYAFGPALSAMAHFYNLPCNVNGLATSSDQLDAQYGHEATAGAMLAYLCGADEIFSIGLLGNAQILSLEKMVLDNYLARQIEHMLAPVSMDETHLGVKLIERVGIGGHFLSQPETRDFTKREYISQWPPAGKHLVEIARQEAREILEKHKPPPLPDGADKQITAVLDRARAAFLR